MYLRDPHAEHAHKSMIIYIFIFLLPNTRFLYLLLYLLLEPRYAQLYTLQSLKNPKKNSGGSVPQTPRMPRVGAGVSPPHTLLACQVAYYACHRTYGATFGMPKMCHLASLVPGTLVISHNSQLLWVFSTPRPARFGKSFFWTISTLSRTVIRSYERW